MIRKIICDIAVYLGLVIAVFAIAAVLTLAIAAVSAHAQGVIGGAPAGFYSQSGPSPSFRNAVRNGNFAINQRVVSGTVTLAASAYGHDGWKAGASGCTYTFATAANGDVTITITAGTLLQIVEGALYVHGTAYALSQQGTAQARMYQGAATGSYVAATTAAPLTATGLTAGTNLTVEFSTGTLDRVQLEAGAAATAFEYRDDEVRRAQRYYAKTYQMAVAAGGVSFPGVIRAVTNGTGGRSSLYWPLPVRMRAAPAVQIYSSTTGASGKVYDEDSAADITAYVYGVGESGIGAIDVTGTASHSVLAHFTASAEL